MKTRPWVKTDFRYHVGIDFTLRIPGGANGGVKPFAINVLKVKHIMPVRHFGCGGVSEASAISPSSL